MGSPRRLTSPGDVDRDGRPDLIARNSATGGVHLYKGTSTGKFAVRDAAGALYRIPGNGKGSFRAAGAGADRDGPAGLQGTVLTGDGRVGGPA